MEIANKDIIYIGIILLMILATIVYHNKIKAIDKRYALLLEVQKEKGYTHKAIAVIQVLQEDFPNLFVKKPEKKKALKLGIKEDLIVWAKDNYISESLLDKALNLWVKGRRYKNALKTGKRYDLDGNEVSHVG